MALGTMEALEEAVADLSLGVDADELVQAQRCVDRLSASLALAYGEFDSAELWDLDGATSMIAWWLIAAVWEAPVPGAYFVVPASSPACR